MSSNRLSCSDQERLFVRLGSSLACRPACRGRPTSDWEKGQTRGSDGVSSEANPFDDCPEVKRLIDIEWLQLAPFVEAGRVAPEYDLANLYSSMKWNAGIGLRAWTKGLVVRVDTAASDEGLGVQMMVAQRFQF